MATVPMDYVWKQINEGCGALSYPKRAQHVPFFQEGKKRKSEKPNKIVNNHSLRL